MLGTKSLRPYWRIADIAKMLLLFLLGGGVPPQPIRHPSTPFREISDLHFVVKCLCSWVKDNTEMGSA